MEESLAIRLRALRERSGWTVVDMAERTGIPKSTLDKYMLRDAPSLPGFEALVALSRGLGVSLDWLVFGVETASEAVELFAYKAARDISLLYFETLIREHHAGKALVDGDLVLGMAAEEWAGDLGGRVATRAKQLVTDGTTKEELLIWRERLAERLRELTQERIQRFLMTKATAAQRSGPTADN